MNNDVPNLRGNALTWVAFILGPLLGAIMAGGGILWTMARQPDRNEFNEVRKTVERMQLDIAVMSERMKRQDNVEQKIDELVKAQKAQAGRGR
jgi:hypothetical protein